VWPDEWQPRRSSNLLLGFLTITGVLIISTAVPWAPVKLAALTWLLTRRLGRTSDDATIGGRNILTELQRRPTVADLAPLSMLAVGAAVIYAFMTAIAPTDAALTTILWVTIPVQTLGGLALIVVAWRGSGSHLLPQEDRVATGEHDGARGQQHSQLPPGQTQTLP